MSEELEEIDDIEGLGFEQALERLERINKKLERKKVPLERAIDLYQQGMELIEYCDERLDEAEGKIEKMTKERKDIDVER
ncbi:MAG: exodeoxyribonuclease VII small subunit [Thermoplasmata archaeon]